MELMSSEKKVLPRFTEGGSYSGGDLNNIFYGFRFDTTFIKPYRNKIYIKSGKKSSGFQN